MKKVLEGELISLAHSILQLKNKADIFELKEKAQHLYEKLSVLAYAEKHFEGPQPTIGKRAFVAFVEEEIGTLDSPSLTENAFSESEIQTTAEASSDLPQEKLEKLSEGEVVEEEALTFAVENDSLEEDFGVHFDQLPQFEPMTFSEEIHPNETEETDSSAIQKADPVEDEVLKFSKGESTHSSKTTKRGKAQTEKEEVPPQKKMDLFSQEKKSLNHQLRKGIKIGLNDRIAFTKHLFENDVSDYNRVLSQLNTFSTPAEAIAFLEEEVKPSYHHWENKEDIETRFVEAVIARFE